MSGTIKLEIAWNNQVQVLEVMYPYTITEHHTDAAQNGSVVSKNSSPVKKNVDGIPYCKCNKLAIAAKVTNPENPNLGRAYYKCISGDCRFFEWYSRENVAPESPAKTGGAEEQIL